MLLYGSQQRRLVDARRQIGRRIEGKQLEVVVVHTVSPGGSRPAVADPLRPGVLPVERSGGRSDAQRREYVFRKAGRRGRNLVEQPMHPGLRSGSVGVVDDERQFFGCRGNSRPRQRRRDVFAVAGKLAWDRVIRLEGRALQNDRHGCRFARQYATITLTCPAVPCVRKIFMKSALLVLGLFVGGSGLAAADESYPQSDLLVEPKQLATPENAKQYIVLDARNQQQYEQGHVPSARWVDHATWAKDFAAGTDAAGWSMKIGRLGITAESRVVVYDDNLTKDAARIWWILRYWGVKDVRLLNGGWAGWTSGKHPVQTEKGPSPPGVPFKAQAESKRLATKKQLLESLKDQKLQIVDARSEKEFCGTEKMTNKRAGAIPGAKQLEWIDLIDKRTQRFKSSGDLRKIFHESGIDLGRPTATHCQSGGRASVMAFGLELMGVKDVSNYYSSWSEWGNADDTPVVPGTAKKK